MGRLELFLSEVSWHAGVLERMAWPSARPSGFSTPSLLSLFYSRALLLSLSLPFLPAPHWFSLSRSPCRESERTECLSFLSAHTSSRRCDSTGSQSAHPLFHWSRNSTLETHGDQLRFLSPPVRRRDSEVLRASSDPALALMITGSSRPVVWMTPRRQRRARLSLPVVFWGKRRDGGESLTVHRVYVFVPTVRGQPV